MSSWKYATIMFLENERRVPVYTLSQLEINSNPMSVSVYFHNEALYFVSPREWLWRQSSVCTSDEKWTAQFLRGHSYNNIVAKDKENIIVPLITKSISCKYQ